MNKFKTFKIGKGILVLGNTKPKHFIPYKERKQWTNALKSGKYKQGFCVLKRENESTCNYCCLGVKLELEKVEWENKSSYSLIAKNNLGNSNAVYIGKCKALGFLGFFPDGCFFKLNEEKHYSLSSVNDSYEVSFSEIAEIINIIWNRNSWYGIKIH